MKPVKAMLAVNALLSVLLMLTGGSAAPLAAQGMTTEPSLSPCCKTSIEGARFCCANCCGSGYRCQSSCEPKKT